MAATSAIRTQLTYGEIVPIVDRKHGGAIDIGRVIWVVRLGAYHIKCNGLLCECRREEGAQHDQGTQSRKGSVWSIWLATGS